MAKNQEKKIVKNPLLCKRVFIFQKVESTIFVSNLVKNGIQEYFV